MPWTEETLDGILASIWSELTRAVEGSGHPFRIASVATVDGTAPAVRGVVLRGTRPALRELEFHTDGRSPKVSQLSANPVAEWLFYDPSQQVQIRALTTVRVHVRNETATAAWVEVPKESRGRYATIHMPGLPITAWAEGGKSSGSGLNHFSVVVGTVCQFDFTRLRAEGHQRARFRWTKTASRPTATWLAP